jgi:tRNA (cmo5U34)-methyltransferase
MSGKDTLFEERIAAAGDFVFDERVVRVFPDMINRSVPGYGLIVPMIGLLARRFAQDGSRLYDLGCSLGAVSLAMGQAVRATGVRIVAADNSPDMVARLQNLLADDPPGVPVEVRLEDIRETEIVDASVVVLNFTLQFIDLDDRPALLRRVAAGLRPGGAVILSEKLRFEDPAEQRRQTDWHHDFKRAQGYSELEIARKREALENVLRPETEKTHRERLLQAGFGEVYRWYQGFGFVSFVAIMPGGDGAGP